MSGKEDEKCCGNCCWFHGEMTDGEGFCAAFTDMVHCSMSCRALLKGKEGDYAFVSRDKMRHHMYVLLATKCWFEGNPHHNVSGREIHDALAFAYQYMKVFGEL